MGGGALESRGLPHRTQCRRSLSSPRVPKSGKKRKRTGAKLGPKLCAGRSGSSAPTPPAFTLTFSPQGGRGGDKQTKPGARRAGTPVKTSSNNTQFDNNIYRRKRDYRLQKKPKKKTSQTGLPLGERTATNVAGGIPIQGPVSGTSQHTTSTGPSINPLRLFLNGTLLNFAEVTISFARVALFQAEGGPSFVPLGVLLPFSLEETAAPAERREERWRDITRMRRRGKRHKEAEPPQISMQDITTKNFYFST